ncbi:MAG TPA: phosphatase PAP2 family protein [Pseudonocardia sp.]|jgi:undecaprenyl-diphosphatase|nr:phosphatase PAP2 family protein [Pseudonocardia sp.]
MATLVATLVLATFGWRYAGGRSPRWLDVRIQTAVDGAVSSRGMPWHLVLDVGEPAVAVVVVLALAAVALLLRRPRLAVLAVVGPGITGVVTTGLKPLVGRLHEGALAYPSGHTGFATAFGLVVALMVISLVGPRLLGAGLILVVGAVIAGGTMALALITQQWHYPTDTLGGFATAVAIVPGVALLIDRIAERRRAPQGP